MTKVCFSHYLLAVWLINLTLVLDQCANLEQSKANSEVASKDETKIVFDHADVLKNSNCLKIQAITIYGEKKSIEAIWTEFFDEVSRKTILKLSKGSKFDPSNWEYKRIDLRHNEVIDMITWWYSEETSTIKSLIFTTSLNNYCLVEREKSLSVDSDDSICIDSSEQSKLKAKATEPGLHKYNKSLKIDINSESNHNSLLNARSFKDNMNKIEKTSPLIKRSNPKI